METYKPNYKNPHIIATDETDKISAHKLHLTKIQNSLDENIQNGWTLVYFDKFMNTVIVTNGGNEVTKLDYAITQLIQKVVFEAFKKKQ